MIKYIYTALVLCLGIAACAQPGSPLIAKYKKQYQKTHQQFKKQSDNVTLLKKQYPAAHHASLDKMMSDTDNQSINDFFKKHKITERDIQFYLEGYTTLIERFAEDEAFAPDAYDKEIYTKVKADLVAAPERVASLLGKMLACQDSKKYERGTYLQRAMELELDDFLKQSIITKKEFQSLFYKLNTDFDKVLGQFERMRY